VPDEPLGDPGDVQRAGSGDSRTPLTPRRIALLVVTAILVVIALLNLDQASIDLIVGSIRMPLVAMLALSCGIGFLGGWWFFRRRDRRQRAT
jgi:uncharacterized integral membrane protein